MYILNRLCASAAAALMCSVLALAQTGVVAVHPEHKEGRMMTMEEAMGLKRNVYPDAGTFRWSGNGYISYENGKWARYETDGSKVEDMPRMKASGTATMPENAANFSYSGTNVAYTSGNSLYVRTKDTTRTVMESTEDGIVYGQTVSRNEFGISGGIFWSPEGNKLAFYKKDERKVTKFPLFDITTRTGTLKEIRYPMNGMDSEHISLGIWDLESGSIVWAETENEFGTDQYLTDISWSPDESSIFIQILDRTQKHLRLNMYDASTGKKIRTILTEDNDRFVEPEDPISFLKGSNDIFIYRTDNRDGYKNLYLCDTKGGIRRLTNVDADVAYVANDGHKVFYTSAEVSPSQNHLFSISVSVPSRAAGRLDKYRFGKPLRLTEEEGWHNVEMNDDCTLCIDKWSSFNVPGVSAMKTADGKLVRILKTAEDKLEAFGTGEVVLGTVKSADGRFDNWYRLYKPLGFDPSKKYPVIVYVYGGPHSQMVNDSWLGGVRMWEMLMAQRGYVVYVQDNRGTQNQGAEYEKAIHRQCGQAEMTDQMKGIEMLKSLPWVDADRIGVHGWSYGGFMTISLMTNYPDVFKVGVAGGPVIDWKWYEVMYGERYMETEETNPEGFEKTSLINKAKDLKGKLLICQGAIDDTVVWEHSLSFVEACIKANVQLDYFPYPTHPHNVSGRDRVHLMDKVSNYFADYL